MKPDLINRLRGIYVLAVDRSIGPLNGKDTFTREFKTPPIQHEAADALEECGARIQALEEALRGVVAVADRKTVEFERARAALTPAPDSPEKTQ